MDTIWTIFKKEMLDALRDRRTLIIMIVVPTIFIPLLLSMGSVFMMKGNNESMEKNLKIAIKDNGNGQALMKRLKRRRDIVIQKVEDIDEAKELVRQDTFDLALEISPEFDQNILEGGTGITTIYHKSVQDTLVYARLASTILGLNEDLLEDRLDSVGITSTYITPIKTRSRNVYSIKESIGKAVGGFLPYFFVIFALMGAMYPAIDLFTGEKERGTMETILTVPVGRLQILFGKMLVVILAGVLSGILTLAGFYLVLKFNTSLPAFVSTMVDQFITFKTLSLITLMLIPLSTFFAGVLIPTSIYAKSFKEAQSLINPFLFLVMIPLFISAIGNIELNVLTACIPVLNVGLATKEIVAGTINYGMLAIVFTSLVVFALLGMLLCVKWFSSERNLMRV